MAEKYISKITLPDGETYNLKGSAPDMSNKMDKENPTGTGALSLNRKSGTTVGSYSVAEGSSCTASGNSSHAEGSGCIASNSYAHAEGITTTSSSMASHSEGGNTTASGVYSHAEGDTTTASDNSAHAEGYKTIASGQYSHAEGYETNASGNDSHAEGHRTKANGEVSHAEGYCSEAIGNYSHAEGCSQAYGKYSHTEGFESSAYNFASHAEGYNTHVHIRYSHAEGSGTIANGESSHAEGNGTKTVGIVSHAEGYHTVANNYQHVQGMYNTIDTPPTKSQQKTDNSSDVLFVGDGTTTVFYIYKGSATWINYATSIYSITVGDTETTDYTFDVGAQQITLTTAPSDKAVIRVRYYYNNGISTYAHIVGNGKSDTNRSNCHTLDWNGNAWYSGDVTVGADATRLAKVTEISNPNLLINPDFKINQRGQTRYTPTTNNIYSVDRWCVLVGYWCTYDNDAKALAVVCGTPKVNTWALAQRIENYEDLKGKTVTFSVHCSAGTDCYQLLINDGKTQSVKVIPFNTNQTVSLTHTVSADATNLNVVICTNGTEGTNALIYLNWAKLEIGSVATPFVPPNPTTELIKCKRYFEVLNTYQDLLLGYAYNGGTSDFICTYQMTPKRTMPTLTSDNFNGIDVRGLGTNYTATVSSYIASVSYGIKGAVFLRVTLSTSINTNVMYFPDISNTQSIYIDAEMY